MRVFNKKLTFDKLAKQYLTIIHVEVNVYTTELNVMEHTTIAIN